MKPLHTTAKRWEKILDLLIDRKLDLELLMETRVDDILRDKDIMNKYVKAGILHIYVGAESASQATLDRYQKNLKIEESKQAIDLINNAGIISETSFVLGMTDENTRNPLIQLLNSLNIIIRPWLFSWQLLHGLILIFIKTLHHMWKNSIILSTILLSRS